MRRRIFRRGSMGVTFSQGAYEFTRANGDIVFEHEVAYCDCPC